MGVSKYSIWMGLSATQLEAFVEVVRRGSFSAAAQNLHLSQSALSQRVLNLEDELGTALLVRRSGGISLTPAGEVLLRYCLTKNELESEVLSEVSSTQKQIAGALRIGAFSSVVRSILMPALSDLVTQNPRVTLQVFSRELSELSKMLEQNEVDFILSSEPARRDPIESHLLGWEEYVLAEADGGACSDIYFDHDPQDGTTFQFFQMQKTPLVEFRRAYLDEIYALIDAVSMGWGRAVLPRHLVLGNPSIRVLAEWQPLQMPVYLQYFRQPFYSQLQQRVRSELIEKVRQQLEARPN
jgi:DNA-binding transcriptional LysR family regulator